MIDQGVINKEQLSHVTFDPASQLYLVDFHLTVVSGQKIFNGTAALEKFKETALGTMSLNQIHLSNRNYIDTFEGETIERVSFKPNQG